MITYRIVNWSDFYENNRSRKVKDLAWVPIPNRHDGERYARLMTRPDAPEIFTAWVLLLQVASRCHPRGTLVRSDGKPHDPASLSLKTRGQQSWFDKALIELTQLGWLEQFTAKAHETATVLPPSCHPCDEEQKERTEQKEQKGREGIQTEPARNFSSIPSVAQVIEAGSRIELPVEECRAFWNHFQAQGWIRSSGVPVTDWNALLHAWKTKWEKEATSNRGAKAGHSGVAINSVAQADSVIKECEKAIERVKDDARNWDKLEEYPWKQLKPDSLKLIKSYRDKIEEVRIIKLGFKV